MVTLRNGDTVSGMKCVAWEFWSLVAATARCDTISGPECVAWGWRTLVAASERGGTISGAMRVGCEWLLLVAARRGVAHFWPERNASLDLEPTTTLAYVGILQGCDSKS